MHSDEKLKIAFDPSELMWSQQFFRDFMKNEIQKDTEGTILYLVTSNTDSAFIERVRDYIGIDKDLVMEVADDDAIVTALKDNKIVLHLTDDEKLNDKINEANPISISEKGTSGTRAIGVYNSVQDGNKLQPQWVTTLTFWTNQIKRFQKDG